MQIGLEKQYLQAGSGGGWVVAQQAVHDVEELLHPLVQPQILAPLRTRGFSALVRQSH